MDKNHATLETQLENDQFRVSKWTIGPGETIPMHEHEHEYVVIPIADGTVLVKSGDGSEVEFTMSQGVSYSRPKGTVHELHNASNSTVVFVEVESLS